MKVLTQPRFWLVLWGGIGALFILYVMIAASVQPREHKAASAFDHDRALLTGEMAEFVYAFPPRGAPQTAFDLDGEAVTLSDFRGKTILVNFWATWCAPCLKELPSLDALQESIGGEAFDVVAIAADPRGADVARSFLERLNITNLTLYMDQNLRLASMLGGADALPVSILYGPDGTEIGRLVGDADWNSPEAKRLIQAAIR